MVGLWIKRVVWASCIALLLIVLIDIAGFVFYYFRDYPMSEEALRYLSAKEVLYRGSSCILPSGIYNIGPDYIYNGVVLDCVGKIAWALSLCSLWTLELWNAWERK